MQRVGFRLRLDTVLVAVIPIAAYCALYTELRSVGTYHSPNLELKLNPWGLCVALCYLAASNLSMAIVRRASRAEMVAQITATPCIGLLIVRCLSPTGREGILDLCAIGQYGMLALIALLGVCPVTARNPRSRRDWLVAIALSLLIGSLSLSLMVLYEMFTIQTIQELSHVRF
jgi:hypothetical protein